MVPEIPESARRWTRADRWYRVRSHHHHPPPPASRSGPLRARRHHEPSGPVIYGSAVMENDAGCPQRQQTHHLAQSSLEWIGIDCSFRPHSSDRSGVNREKPISNLGENTDGSSPYRKPHLGMFFTTSV